MAANRRPGLHRWLDARYGRKGEALYISGTGFAAIALSGAAAYVLDQPLVLLTMGPTVHLLFSHPLEPGSSPRSAITGHLVALSTGFLSLSVFGVADTPGDTLSYAYAAGPTALAVGLTGSVMFAARAWHPPAGITAAVAGMGLLGGLGDFLVLACATVLLTYAGWLVNRASGVPVPLWSAVEDRHR